MNHTIAQPDVRDVRDEILALWKRNLPTATRERYDWLYANGPAQAWTVRDLNGAAIGSMGVMGRTMKVFGDIRPVGQPIDLNVDKLHRLGGPALQLQRRLAAAVDAGEIALAYGLPNAQAEPVLRRMGYRVLGTMGRWTKPLRSENLLAERLKHRGLRKMIAMAVDAGLCLSSADIWIRRPKNIRAEIVDHFDERFDRLWETASRKYAIIGERTAEYLQWRFAKCPDVRYRTLCLCDEKDRLSAYLTYSQAEGRAYVGDVLFLENGDLEILLAEFMTMLRRMHKRAVTMIYYGHPFVAKTLRRFGFLPRESQWKVMVYANKDDSSAVAGANDPDAGLPRVMNGESWYITRADIDT